MTDIDVWHHPVDDEPQFFASWGHDVSPEEMIVASFEHLQDLISRREAIEWFQYHCLYEGPVERTHYRLEDGRVEPISVLNVDRDAHEVTREHTPDNPEKIRKRLEIPE